MNQITPHAIFMQRNCCDLAKSGGGLFGTPTSHTSLLHYLKTAGGIGGRQLAAKRLFQLFALCHNEALLAGDIRAIEEVFRGGIEQGQNAMAYHLA